MPGSARTIRNIDWQQYTSIFPDRYVKQSQSDALMMAELSKRRPGKALDVGGGANGTPYLVEWADDYVLLDPNVESELWSITWRDIYSYGSNNPFDVILARGSINYIGWAGQLPTLINILSDGGVFMFNTFVSPPSRQIERRYVSASGSGVERAKLVPGGLFGQIQHELEPDEEGFKVVHRFYYYPISFLKEIIEEGLSCRIIEDGNSALFICEKK